MSAMREFWGRLKALFRRGRDEREMQEEMRAHLDRETEQNIQRGMTPTEARYAAQRNFGGVAQLQEREREARGWMGLENFVRDLRFAARMLRKSPGFTTVAVLTLAFGLAANITIFGIISFFFFKPLPVADADRLVVLARQSDQFEMALPVSWLDLQDYREEVREFSDLLAIWFRPVHLGQPGRAPDRTYIEGVTANYFSMLGVQPLHGRLFLPGEGQHLNADPVVVLSHDYWKTKLGGDPRIVGESVTINGHPFTVVGITPESFSSVQWALLPSAFIPITMVPTIAPWDAGAFESRDWPIFKTIAKLAPEATVEQARAAVQVVHRRLIPEHRVPADEERVRMLVRPESLSRPDPSVAGIIPFAAAVFMGLVLLVLLIACANVANLLLARAAQRQREMGIRSAVGASRGRLFRQVLTESVLLALLAGAVGFFLSFFAGDLLQRIMPQGEIPVKPDESWDWNSVWFTLGASVFVGTLLAIVPALRATSVDVQSVIKGAPGQSRRARHWFRNGLVIAQVVFCVIVLVCGGLFVRSLGQMATLDLGFESDRVLLASVDPGLNGYSEARAQALVEQLVERVQALPGVEAAAVATYVPLDTNLGVVEVQRADEVSLPPGEAQLIQAGRNRVHRDYFATLGIRPLRGRLFTRADTEQSAPVVVINETMARRLWPDQEALGRHLVVAGDGVPREVVGVVKDGRYFMLGEQNRAYLYAPITQMYGGPLALHVRSRGDPATLSSPVRQVLLAMDENLPIFNVRTMEEHLRTSVFGFMPLRLGASLAGVQGLLGLFLAVLGIYGVVAYSVTQRHREIGIRMALGASPVTVLRLVMRGALRLTAVGLVIGVVVALGLSHILSGLLYGLNPIDVPVFGGVIVLLLAVAALACYLPARRALRVDPMVAVRSE
jgi:predicted permease